MQKSTISPSKSDKVISRSSSLDQTAILISDEPSDDSNFKIETSDHLQNCFYAPINYKKFIISPKISSVPNIKPVKSKDSILSSNIDNNNQNASSQNGKEKASNQKRKLVPISKAKDRVMQLMKLSNDEYIAQIENMKRSENGLNGIRQIIKDMGPVKFDILHHPILLEIAMHNYTIDYCMDEADRIKKNIDSYAILYNEIEQSLISNPSNPEPQETKKEPSGKKENSAQASDSILVNEESTHRSSVDAPNPRPMNKLSIIRRRTNTTNRTSLPIDKNPIIQNQEQPSNQLPQQSPPPQNKPQESQKSQQPRKRFNTAQPQQQQQQPQRILPPQKRPQTPPQQPSKGQQQLLPQNNPKQIPKENLVDISGFISECLTLRTNTHIFIQRRSLLHKLYLPFTLFPDAKYQVDFIDPDKPIEQQSEIKEEKEHEKMQTENSNIVSQDIKIDPKTKPLLSKMKEDAKNAFIINPSVDKVGYLLNPEAKSGRIMQRFILKANEMTYEDIEVIADALYDLSSEYLTRDEIIGILFDTIWTLNPSKYPIVPRVNSFWVPYIMDLIPAAVDPPYLSEKWKRMTFHQLSNTTDWPLRKAVDSLFDLYLYSNPFEIGRCFSNTINLIASAVQEMVQMEGGNPDDVEIDFDQLFNLLIICIFASGLPTITGPLSYASYFDQYACDNNEIHFAMSHMEGLCAHLPKMNFKELREKSNKLKEQYMKEEKGNDQ